MRHANNNSLATAEPSTAGNVSVAAPSGACPSFAYGVQNVALSLAKMMSKNGRMVTPRPTAAPDTPAINGLGKFAKHLMKSLSIGHK